MIMSMHDPRYGMRGDEAGGTLLCLSPPRLVIPVGL